MTRNERIEAAARALVEWDDRDWTAGQTIRGEPFTSLLRVAEKYVAFCLQAGVKADANSLGFAERLHAQALAAIQRAKVAALSPPSPSTPAPADCPHPRVLSDGRWSECQTCHHRWTFTTPAPAPAPVEETRAEEEPPPMCRSCRGKGGFRPDGRASGDHRTPNRKCMDCGGTGRAPVESSTDGVGERR